MPQPRWGKAKPPESAGYGVDVEVFDFTEALAALCWASVFQTDSGWMTPSGAWLLQVHRLLLHCVGPGTAGCTI